MDFSSFFLRRMKLTVNEKVCLILRKPNHRWLCGGYEDEPRQHGAIPHRPRGHGKGPPGRPQSARHHRLRAIRHQILPRQNHRNRLRESLTKQRWNQVQPKQTFSHFRPHSNQFSTYFSNTHTPPPTHTPHTPHTHPHTHTHPPTHTPPPHTHPPPTHTHTHTTHIHTHIHTHTRTHTHTHTHTYMCIFICFHISCLWWRKIVYWSENSSSSQLKT